MASHDIIAQCKEKKKGNIRSRNGISNIPTNVIIDLGAMHPFISSNFVAKIGCKL